VATNSTPDGMRRLPTQEDPGAGPRSSGERALRLTRDRLFVILAMAAIPAGLAAPALADLDGELAFAVLWLGAAVMQAPGLRTWPDRLALAALLAYVLSFLLPASPASQGGIAANPLLGYQVLGMPPVGPLPHLPPGELVEIVVGLSAWLANPIFLVALACYRYREGALTIVLGVAALVFGAMELPAADLAIGHALWLAAPLLLAAAARWARRDW
jgi:hypothetical protein